MDKQPEFDCIGKAEREGQPEPFSLIASDPLASYFVDMWVAFSKGDIVTALKIFASMSSNHLEHYKETPRSEAKLNNAEDMAIAMRQWRRRQGFSN